MPKITFYPLGNADSIKIDLADERNMLIDYCHQKDADDEDDKRIDLADQLKTELEEDGRNDFDVVGFTHADDDHVHGAADFFWFDHADKYQAEDRVKIKELWVPSIMVNGPAPSNEDARVIRQEARHRLREDYGVRIFGQPDSLDKWLKEEGIDPASRRDRITTAGRLIPGFSQENGRVEIFVHAPFSFRLDDDEEDRNNNSLVLHLTFFEGDRCIRCMLGADAEHEAWNDIVRITRHKGNQCRLEYDIFKIAHHCSYTALSDEKGDDVTDPRPNIRWLFEQGKTKCVLVSTSNVIPSTDTKQPPHRQTAKYYENIAGDKDGDFLVTMQNPTSDDPRPTVIDITKYGSKLLRRVAVGAVAAVTRRAPRAGWERQIDVS